MSRGFFGVGVAMWFFVAAGGGPRASANGLAQTCSTILAEEMRIGGLGDSSDHIFSEIFAIAGRPSGSSYVLDTHPYSIREYDPGGNFVRLIGGEGEGPGEYLSPLGLAVMPEGQLAVWDQRTRRISIYGSDGELDGLVHVDAMTIYDDRAFLVGIGGEFYVKVRSSAPMMIDGQYFTVTRSDYVRVGRNGKVVDTLRVAEPTSQSLPESLMILTQSGYRKPFAVEPLSALSPLGYLVSGVNDEYAFSINHPTQPVEVRRPDLQGVRVSGSEREQWQQRVEWSERRSGMSFRDVPDRKPSYRDLWVDSDGRIWVHRYSEAVRRNVPIPEIVVDGDAGDPPGIMWWEPSIHDVYRPDGSLLYCVTLPDHAEIMASTGNLVWGVVRGSLGEEHVVRWRIE